MIYMQRCMNTMPLLMTKGLLVYFTPAHGPQDGSPYFDFDFAFTCVQGEIGRKMADCQ